MIIINNPVAQGIFLSNVAALDFGSIAAQSAAILTMTVMGAVDGNPVYIGIPAGSANTNCPFTAWVSAPNTVTIMCTNNNPVMSVNPVSGVFNATVYKL